MRKLWLAGALLLFAPGCSRHRPTAPPAPPSQPPATAEPAPAESAPQASSAPEEPLPAAAPAPPAKMKAAVPPVDAKIARGMSRGDLLDRLGGCAHLVTLVPGGGGARSVEVYEPDPTNEGCVKQFGERQFMVVAGKLDSFIPGLNRAPPPRLPMHGRNY